MKFTRIFKGCFFSILLSSFFFDLGEKGIMAGPFVDDMAKCLVRSTSSKDNILLGRWLVRVYGEHSESKGLTYISDYNKKIIDRDVAKLFTRLLTQDCEYEVKKAYKYEGLSVMSNAFQVLGEVAGKELLEDRNVSKAINKFTEYVDYEKLEYLK